jgi:AcrR family transcriptional regulator
MRRSLTHEETREAILDAVGRLIERFGYSKMTIDDVAREAGIGKGTVYLHFPSKEEMGLSWIDRGHDEILEALREIAKSGGSPAEAIKRIMLARVMIPFDRIQNFMQGLDELFAAIRPSLLVRRHRYEEEEAEIIGNVLLEGRRLGVFTFDDALSTAHILLIVTSALLPYSLSTCQLGRRDEIESKTLRIANLVLNGLIRRS